MTQVFNIKPDRAQVDTGVTDPAPVVDRLGEMLRATYDLVIRTHEVHWNVEGPLFYAVHNLTESQYTELFEAVDEIAERIRALGALAPMRPDAVVEGEAGETPAQAGDMIEDLGRRHEALARLCHEAIATAERLSDPVTADLATARSASHEKAAWMLRALAAGKG